MKHIFIINPKAGQGITDVFSEEIKQVCQEEKVPYEIHYTQYPGHGEVLAKEIGEKGEKSRLYACGGDGTLNEVANGILNYHHLELACIPQGTGNDFVRNFPGDFHCIRSQIRGESRDIDLISYDTGEKKRIFINMCNIGFDSNVVVTTLVLKKKPLIYGTMAYGLSIFIEWIKKRKIVLWISRNLGDKEKKSLLMLTVSNGKYCGGGLKGMPNASPWNHRLDVCEIKDISRWTFFKLFPKYVKGLHTKEEKLASILSYYQQQTLDIESEESDIFFAIDGEIEKAKKIQFKLLSKKIKFSLPQEKISK